MINVDTGAIGLVSNIPGKNNRVDTNDGYVLWKAVFSPFGCSFIQKVCNAQHNGAAAAIIADNTCQCKHAETCHSELDCEMHEPIMADDGSGFDIMIGRLRQYFESLLQAMK